MTGHRGGLCSEPLGGDGGGKEEKNRKIKIHDALLSARDRDAPARGCRCSGAERPETADALMDHLLILSEAISVGISQLNTA